MKTDIILVGTLFDINGSGVPEMNENFYDYMKTAVAVSKIDVMKRAEERFGTRNKVFSRNLELLELRKVLRNKNIHVMHTIDLCSTFPVLDFSNIAKARIVTVHDFYSFIRKPDKRLLSWVGDLLKRKCYKFLKNYNHVIARSVEAAEILSQRFSLSPENISVQGPIIDHSYEPLKIYRKEEKVIIGYINNFGWNKSTMLKYFIDVFKSISSDDIELHIYGKGFPFGDLIRSDPRIKYKGFLDSSSFHKTLASFDAYLSTSTYEGFGIPIAKAKAMKIPVLCYDGDIPAITKNNTCLWDEQNLKDIIEERRWEGTDTDRAYSDVKSLRPEVVVQQTKEIYDKVFSGKR